MTECHDMHALLYVSKSLKLYSNRNEYQKHKNNNVSEE
jgi:hypothetical protein